VFALQGNLDEGAKRYGNPDREDVPQDFQEKRKTYYDLLDCPMDVEAFVTGVQHDLREALAAFDRNLPQNGQVSLRETGKKRIRLTPLDPQPEPMQLRALKGEIGQRWPMTSLLDVLKEAELRVGFTSLFKGLGNRVILYRETLQRRLLLCLYGLGSNTGLKRVLVGSGAPLLSGRDDAEILRGQRPPRGASVRLGPRGYPTRFA